MTQTGSGVKPAPPRQKEVTMRIVLIPVRLVAILIWAVGTILVGVSVFIAACCGNLEALWKR